MNLAFLVEVVETEEELLAYNRDVRFVEWTGFKLRQLAFTRARDKAWSSAY